MTFNQLSITVCLNVGQPNNEKKRKMKALKVLKVCIGIALALAAVVGGLYVGIWLCLVGGIVQVIEGAKATPVSSMDVALGIARFMFAGLAGFGTCFLTGAIASIFLKD